MSVQIPRRALAVFVSALLLVPLAIPSVAAEGDTEVTVPDGMTVGIGTTTPIDGLAIGGFVGTVLVTIAVEGGDLGATASGEANVTDNGDLLRISGLSEDVNATLETVTYTAPGVPGVVDAQISVLVTVGEPALNIENGHWYEFVTDQVTWTQALEDAADRELGGQTGYLATVTSASENEFIRSKLTADGWMGASDREVEGTWKWVAGPEEGLVFWQGTGDGSPVDGMYSNWRSGEPNQSGDEDGAQFYTDGQWNDLSITDRLLGYVVEYGGLDGTVTADASGSFSITVYDVPGAPTGLGASAGHRSVDLTWTAPGQPVTGYRVEISDDGGATWTTVFADIETTHARITDLVNGVEYTFRVAALNSVGVGEWTDTVTATPVATAPPPAETTPVCEYNPKSHTDTVAGWTVPCWTAPTTADRAADATAPWQLAGVAFGLANGLVETDENGEIGANANATRAQMAMMLYALARKPNPTGANPFGDVPAHYSSAVEWLAGLGITNGVAADTFGGERPITRAEMVTLIWRMHGSPSAATTHGFVDDIPDWSATAVSWAHGVGIVKGRSDTLFDPNAPATVAEVLVVLHRWIHTLD